MLRHVPEVSVEEFVDGEEFTYDTVCAGGSILFENIMWYRPRPLQMQMHEWISPASIVVARPRLCRICRAAVRWVARCCPRWASAPGSPTWSGTARPMVRRCSARSERGRRAPEWST